MPLAAGRPRPACRGAGSGRPLPPGRPRRRRPGPAGWACTGTAATRPAVPAATPRHARRSPGPFRLPVWLAGLPLGLAGPLGGAGGEVGDALGWSRGLGVEAAGDAAGAVGEAAGLD